ncbi:odorant receptor 10-like [Xylocopa sonorina]|uniref:odorant receptor 10-like n=1 Tax=Xylocopa sonorina TaxID=1818115 RepID=UPI00403AE47C
MAVSKSNDVSIGITSVFMKLVGLWMAADRAEQRVRDCTLSYTLIAILFAVWVQARDIYYSWGDFSACLFTTCNILSVAVPLFKILVLLAHRKDFFRLILYVQEKFLQAEYDDYERKIVMDCKRKCTFFVCLLIFSTKGTLICYVINPLVANIGKNESDRILPFNMWIDSLILSPYFELAFVLQVLSLYHIGVSYFCFDNFLCIMNLHAASQFRILQYRMAKMADLMRSEKREKYEKLATSPSNFARISYAIFKEHVRQHQTLIAYCDKLEEVFNLIVLGQVLTFSLLICLDGYQVLMPIFPTRRRLIFTFHLSAALSQLLMFTYSCDCIIRESTRVALAVYSGPWPLLPTTTSGRMMRKDLTLVIMRSGSPCCLTARRFFVVSLETYTGVLSSAVSYFTLLKQRGESISS